MQRIRVSLVLVLCLLLRTGPASEIAEPADEASRINRLVATGKLWAAIKYFHPYLAYRNQIDWDKALVEAIPKINAAKSAEEYSAAVEGMLSALGDSATKVIRKIPATPATSTSSDLSLDPSFRTTPEGVLLVSMSNYGSSFDFNGTLQRTSALNKEILKAHAVLFDLRRSAPATEDLGGSVAISFSYGNTAGMLSAKPYSPPGERRRMHVGFVPQQGGTSGGYESAFYISQGQTVQPAAGAKDLPVVFLVNDNSELPSAALALQASGNAAIVAEGTTTDAPVVSAQRFKLTDGVEADIRLAELIYPDGTTGLQPDLTVPASPISGEQNPAFKAALDLARNFKPSTAVRKKVAASAGLILDKVYADVSYPTAEYRVLAAIRVWAVINYFFPYRDLVGEDWDGVLREFISRMEKAGNTLEYNLAVAEMVTHFHDGHGFVRGPALREFLGVAPPPLRLRMIEDVPVVTGFLDEKAAKDAGAEIGDVVLKVEGEDALQKLKKLAPYLSASTPQWQMYRAVTTFLNGPEDSTVTLSVRDPKDRIKELKLPRKAAFYQGGSTQRTGEPFRLLAGNIGYADLDRLEVSMVDEMFEKFKDARAIIFDDRTYPHGTAWAIAPRLTEQDSVVAALFTRRVLMAPEAPAEVVTSFTTQSFYQRTPHTDKWRYKGKTVMLIDERAISQAEHTGLFLEAANGTKFIGSPTAGANGDVTNFSVPGGIWISFSGQSVRHADGRQLQRIGLVPDLEVRPTIQGIRTGKDEVLERAIQYLQTELR